MTNDHTEQARAFLQANSLGVLATVAPGGGVRARTVYYAANEKFEVYVVTLQGTRKVEDIASDGRVAFVVSDPNAPSTIQLEGTMVEQPNTPIDDPMVQKLMDTLMEKGETFAPLTHLDVNKIIFYKLTPTWVRFGDFAHTSGSSEVLSVIIP
ncbi:MAG: pyridoxamine 5'-phosphate oxidase family protein [Patescibacteria group bacterium]